MVFVLQTKSVLIAVSLALSSLPLTSAGYVRALAPRADPSGVTYACTNPYIDHNGCPVGSTYDSSTPKEVTCYFSAGDAICSYDIYTNVLDPSTSQSNCDPTVMSANTIHCTSSPDYVCQNAVKNANGAVTCSNNFRKRNGVSRNPEWMKKRQAVIKKSPKALLSSRTGGTGA